MTEVAPDTPVEAPISTFSDIMANHNDRREKRKEALKTSVAKTMHAASNLEVNVRSSVAILVNNSVANHMLLNSELNDLKHEIQTENRKAAQYCRNYEALSHELETLAAAMVSSSQVRIPGQLEKFFVNSEHSLNELSELLQNIAERLEKED